MKSGSGYFPSYLSVFIAPSSRATTEKLSSKIGGIRAGACKLSSPGRSRKINSIFQASYSNKTAEGELQKKGNDSRWAEWKTVV